MLRSLIIAAIVTATAGGALEAHKAPPAPLELGKETSIPLMRYSGLYDFEPDGDRGVWLQDQRRHWYYARILGPCLGLPFATRIGVDTRYGGDQLDRTGRLLVDGSDCRIESLTTSAGPPPKVKKPKKTG